MDPSQTLRAYGYTDEQITAMAEENTRKLRAIAAMNQAGRERGTVDHDADRENYLSSLRVQRAT